MSFNTCVGVHQLQRLVTLETLTGEEKKESRKRSEAAVCLLAVDLAARVKHGNRVTQSPSPIKLELLTKYGRIQLVESTNADTKQTFKSDSFLSCTTQGFIVLSLGLNVCNTAVVSSRY